MENNIEGFEGEKIKCSEFTEKVGKDIIDYKFEYKNNLKIIEMQNKELETYKKIAEKLANVLSKRGIVYFEPVEPYKERTPIKKVVINGKDEIIDWARNEVK